MALTVFVILFAIMDIVAPYGLKWLFIVVRLLLSGIILFFCGMATLWNAMETNAIVSGKLAMEILLQNLLKHDR